jgi:hypothetical protein
MPLPISAVKTSGVRGAGRDPERAKLTQNWVPAWRAAASSSRTSGAWGNSGACAVALYTGQQLNTA